MLLHSRQAADNLITRLVISTTGTDCNRIRRPFVLMPLLCIVSVSFSRGRCNLLDHSSSAVPPVPPVPPETAARISVQYAWPNALSERIIDIRCHCALLRRCTSPAESLPMICLHKDSCRNVHLTRHGPSSPHFLISSRNAV